MSAFAMSLTRQSRYGDGAASADTRSHSSTA
jgi:hypothetical protein